MHGVIPLWNEGRKRQDQSEDESLFMPMHVSIYSFFFADRDVKTGEKIMRIKNEDC